MAIHVPDDVYPWDWSVCRWLEGETAETASIGDLPSEHGAGRPHAAIVA